MQPNKASRIGSPSSNRKLDTAASGRPRVRPATGTTTRRVAVKSMLVVHRVEGQKSVTLTARGTFRFPSVFFVWFRSKTSQAAYKNIFRSFDFGADNAADVFAMI